MTRNLLGASNTRSMVEPYLGVSIFAYEYASRLGLVDRAVTWRELPQFFTPLEFLTWARKYKLPVPNAFIQCTFARGEPIQYWHDLCAILAEELNETQAELQATRYALASVQEESEEQAQRTFEEWLGAQAQIDRLLNDHKALVTSLRNALTRAEDQNSSLVEQITAKANELSQEDNLTTTERKSLLTPIRRRMLSRGRFLGRWARRRAEPARRCQNSYCASHGPAQLSNELAASCTWLKRPPAVPLLMTLAHSSLVSWNRNS